MTLEVLVSAVNQQIRDLPERMHLESDAVIVNQTDHLHMKNISIRTISSVDITLQKKA